LILRDLTQGFVKETANTVVTNQPFEQVWSHFISNISKNFFEIDTVDENSGFLSIGYHADPEQPVDCGTIHSESPSALWKGVLTPGPQAKAALFGG
jgi:hypothetical protein